MRRGGCDINKNGAKPPLKGAARSVRPIGRNIKKRGGADQEKLRVVEPTTPAAPTMVLSLLFCGSSWFFDATPPLDCRHGSIARGSGIGRNPCEQVNDAATKSRQQRCRQCVGLGKRRGQGEAS